MVARRYELARECGLFRGVYLRGALVGGTLSYVHQGSDAYLVLIGHDPRYDDLQLGNICLWLAIEHLIGLGVSRYHLLWGKSFYKRQFLAQEHALYTATVFANPLVALLWRVQRWGRTAIWSRAAAAARRPRRYARRVKDLASRFRAARAESEGQATSPVIRGVTGRG
jgi:CelD/BcsL family acetyltransferase involved in cellulose biosynthesis